MAAAAGNGSATGSSAPEDSSGLLGGRERAANVLGDGPLVLQEPEGRDREEWRTSRPSLCIFSGGGEGVKRGEFCSHRFWSREARGRGRE